MFFFNTSSSTVCNLLKASSIAHLFFFQIFLSNVLCEHYTPAFWNSESYQEKQHDPNPGELYVGTSLPLEGDNCCLLILILCLCGPQDLPSLKKYNGDGRLNSRVITATPVRGVYCWKPQHNSRETDNFYQSWRILILV